MYKIFYVYDFSHVLTAVVHKLPLSHEKMNAQRQSIRPLGLYRLIFLDWTFPYEIFELVIYSLPVSPQLLPRPDNGQCYSLLP
jgi:hypothetical protein